MNNKVKPKAGQVWKVKKPAVTAGNSVVVDGVINGIVSFDSGGTTNCIHDYFEFIPQTDLEWLAVNVSQWDLGNLSYASKGSEKSVVWTLMPDFKGYCTVGLYTKQQWQECRYELGLDERPETKGSVKIEKPPLGLKPRAIHARQRASEIVAAMSRYVESDKPIPRDWMIELSDLYGEELVN